MAEEYKCLLTQSRTTPRSFSICSSLIFYFWRKRKCKREVERFWGRTEKKKSRVFDLCCLSFGKKERANEREVFPLFLLIIVLVCSCGSLFTRETILLVAFSRLRRGL
jgi:hypothetical protein